MYSFFSLNIIILLFSSTKFAKTQQFPIVNLGLGATMEKPPSFDSDSKSVTLSDIFGSYRSMNAFSGFTRSFKSITQRFEDSAMNTTILAPPNSAIKAMSLKPWEDQNDYKFYGDEVYEGQSGEDKALQNLRRFIEAHIVPVSPWREGEKVKTLAGKELWWQNRDGIRKIQPDDIEVEEVLCSVSNGELWMTKGLLS